MDINWDNKITFYVNGKQKNVVNVDPRTTLLTYLRENLSLTGTKLGCGEGGCGACTVMISRLNTNYDNNNDNNNNGENVVLHVSANACLTPLCSLDGAAITTIEALGDSRRGLHPIQARIAALGGSQCGFCTPGIVMSVYSWLRSHPRATAHELEEMLDGNLCRCTGYRPLLDAAKSLAHCGDYTDNNNCNSSNNEDCGGGGGYGCGEKNCCKNNNNNNNCCKNNNNNNNCCNNKDNNTNHHQAPTILETQLDGTILSINSTENTINSLPSLQKTLILENITEPIFPPALFKYQCNSVKLTFNNEFNNKNELITWYQPINLKTLHELKEKYKNSVKLVVGNTEIGIETRFKCFEYSTFINPIHIKELNILYEENDGSGIRIGANITINKLREFIIQLEKKTPYTLLKGLIAIKNMLTWFASNQIRNVACIAGNIVTASPISDLNPMLLACKAIIRVSNNNTLNGEYNYRDIPITEFFISYRKVNLKDNEILENIFIPYTSEYEFVVPSKQARRREDDISIVTSGIRFIILPENNQWIIKDCSLSYGGMSPITINAIKTQQLLLNQPWCNKTFENVYDTLKNEFLLPENVPGGQAEYRMALAASFLFRSFIQITLELQKLLDNKYSEHNDEIYKLSLDIIDKRDISASENFLNMNKPYTSGIQNYTLTPLNGNDSGIQTANINNLHSLTTEEFSNRTPVGDPIVHKSATLQVTGEALYTDDINVPQNTAHAALVTSTRGHANIISIDTSIAETCPGFIAYFSSKDVIGSNHIGAIIKDEEVFVTKEVKYYGAVIGIILADTHEQAVYAARKVIIQYEDLPVIVSIEEAIVTKSFYPTIHEINHGNVEELINNNNNDLIIVEGEGRIGSQEHFYLETNCTLVIPKENGQLEIFSSTQNQSKTQMTCAHVCGIPANNVVCRVKRMGGGFGGKETRTVFIAVTAALSAYITGRPVKINIERDVDMSLTGQRHAFYYKYKAGCIKSTGKLSFMKAELYSNGGFSWDLSQPVMDRALFHSDNGYNWPNMNIKGYVCQTNQPSHTAFRGFGGPQGMFLCDIVLNHLAETIKMPLLQFKEINLYKNGDKTHYGQLIEEYHIPDMIQNLKKTANIINRENEIKQFNINNRWKKRGMSIDLSKYGINFTAKFYNQGGALVLIYTDGTVLVSHGGTEMGQGLNTKMIQVAAQAFNISHTMVHVEESSTSCVPNSSPTAASMSTDLYGMAVLNACEQLRERLIPIRNKLDKNATWSQIITTAYFDRINLSAQGFYIVPTERTGYDWDINVNNNSLRGHPFNYFTQGVACTEVEIDCLTGDSKILRADILMDIGRSINPTIDIGQIEGAFVQGYGYCTMEELIWGDLQHKWVRPGQLFTRGPGGYKIPAFNDVPIDMRIHLTDTDNRFAVHSSKAVGEPPFYLGVSAYFAIRNAIQAARLEFSNNNNSNNNENYEDKLKKLQTFDYIEINSPITSERIRTACQDPLMMRCNNNNLLYQAKGSW